MIDAEVTWRGGGLQSRIEWVRLPPASLWKQALMPSVQRRLGHSKEFWHDCSEHGFSTEVISVG